MIRRIKINRLNRRLWLCLGYLLMLNGCSTRLTLADLTDPQSCFDRDRQPWTFIVDSHLHFRPFNHDARAFSLLVNDLKANGILFANVYGIGQTLPENAECRYFTRCPGTPVLPSMLNDQLNAQSIKDEAIEGIHLTLSMSFPDLSNPDALVDQFHRLDRQFPSAFRWVGEVNLVKQALFANGHRATSESEIARLKPFMALLAKRQMPLAIHSDLGDNSQPNRYVYLMKTLLTHYPDNKIIWVHMGLSREQDKLTAAKHLSLMQSFLDTHPNLMLDISWQILWQSHFSLPQNKALYIDFLNRNAHRILTGTDMVPTSNSTRADYKKQLQINSMINKELNNHAFRRIALGQNYFDLLGLNFQAPPICPK